MSLLKMRRDIACVCWRDALTAAQYGADAAYFEGHYAVPYEGVSGPSWRRQRRYPGCNTLT